jgi:hypothetical protein
VITRALHWAAIAGALCSTIGFARAGLLWLAAFEVLCGLGLVAGHTLGKSRVTSAAALTLIVQTLILGAIWPSAITIAALIIAPAFFLALRDIIKNAAGSRTLIYVAASSALAAWSVAAEAWWLATLPSA